MEYVGSRNLHRLLIETPDKFLGTYPLFFLLSKVKDIFWPFFKFVFNWGTWQKPYEPIFSAKLSKEYLLTIFQVCLELGYMAEAVWLNRSCNIFPRFTRTFLTFGIRSKSIFFRPGPDPRAEQWKMAFIFIRMFVYYGTLYQPFESAILKLDHAYLKVYVNDILIWSNSRVELLSWSVFCSPAFLYQFLGFSS